MSKYLNMWQKLETSRKPLKASGEYVQWPFLAFPPNQIGPTLFVHRITLLSHTHTKSCFQNYGPPGKPVRQCKYGMKIWPTYNPTWLDPETKTRPSQVTVSMVRVTNTVSPGQGWLNTSCIDFFDDTGRDTDWSRLERSWAPKWRMLLFEDDNKEHSICCCSQFLCLKCLLVAVQSISYIFIY